MKREIFVIGGNHHNMLGVIRSLGEKGLRPQVIIQTTEKKPYVAYSKYIREKWIVPDEKSVLETLLREAVKYSEKPVVIACADNLSSLLDVHCDELAKVYQLPGAKEQGRITRLMDKEVMSELAEEVGLRVPHSVATNTNLNEDISISLPWIIKPLVSKDGVKADIARIYSLEEWNEYKKQHQSRVQVQQLIEKEFEYQLIGLSLNGGDEVIVPGVSHVIRPQSNTNTGFLRYEPLGADYAVSLENTKKFLKETGYSGLFSMEFLRGTDGKDYFMEINFRNDGNAICVTAAGVNLPYIWYQYNVGDNYHKEIDKRKVSSVYIMPEVDDFRNVVRNHIGLGNWLKDVKRTNRFMEFERHDQSPFWHLLKQLLKRKVKCAGVYSERK